MPYPLLLPLMWWSTASFAADDVPANPDAPAVAPASLGAAAPAPPAVAAVERPLANQAEVAAYVAAVRLQYGGAVLLAAAGPDAEHLALKVAGALPAGQVRVLRIGYIGDIGEEMGRALVTSGLGCGIRLGPTTAGTWLASTHGGCAPPLLPTTALPTATAPTATAPTATGPTPAPPPATAAAPAPLPGSVPGAPYLAPPPPPPDPTVLAATYKLVALERVDNPKPREDLPDATWAVRDGRGKTLSALDFARRTGDSSSERRIEREGRTAKAVGVALAVGGGALVVAGLGVLVAREAGAPQWSAYEPNDADYTNAEYFEALAQAEADFRSAEDAHAIRADDRVWISGFLIGAGTLTVATSPLALRGVADRHGVPAIYWDVEAADALIDGHNASVRQRIGLPEPVAPVVVPPKPVEEEEDDFGLDDPPEDEPLEEGGLDDPEDLDEPEGLDEDAPKLAPGGPGGRLIPDHDAPAPALTFTPFFGFAPSSGAPSGAAKGFGVAGLTGTF
ncbi:MAG: hypothetical protein Q8P18_30660 [Pseudomonadota bacterium]|nr:hypothetical protein [Pseudomonadota bacterium]